MTVYNSSIRSITDKVCTNDATHTTSRWLKDPDDKTRNLCESCYKTALAQKHKAKGRVCSNDASHKTSRWLKDPHDTTRDLCGSCYNAALAQKHKAERRVCSNDHSHTTSRWLKDPNDKTRDLCRNCYHTTHAQNQKAEGRVCSNGASHTTKQWRKDPNDRTRDLCKSCYNTALAKKYKADKKRKRKELNLESSNDVASQSISEPPLKRKRVAKEDSPILSTSDLSFVENRHSPTAEIIEQTGVYGDVEHLFLPSIHDSSVFPRANALQTEFMGEIPDPGVADDQSFQAIAHRVRENRQSSADIGGNESGLFGFPDGWNASSSITTTHEQLPYSYSQFISDNFSSLNQTSFNYLPDNHHDSL